jgi:hypothetical protein
LTKPENNTNQKKKETDDARKNRRMWEQREQSGFGNSLGSNAKSFITFLLFSKMTESS